MPQDVDIEKAKQEHDAQMQAKDEAHAAELKRAKEVIVHRKIY
jgi:hypothetical protein